MDKDCLQDDLSAFFAEKRHPLETTEMGMEDHGSGSTAWNAEMEKVMQIKKNCLKELELLLRQTEKQALRIREQITTYAADSGNMLLGTEGFLENTQSKKQFLMSEAQVLGIRIWETGGEKEAIRIDLPVLLPHRKSKPEILFKEPLLQVILSFLQEGKGTQFLKKAKCGQVLLVLEHCYQAGWMVRDNDNIEVKALLDTLVTAGLLSNDKGTSLCILQSASQISAEQDDQEKSMDKGTMVRTEGHTKILLIPQSEKLIQGIWERFTECP